MTKLSISVWWIFYCTSCISTRTLHICCRYRLSSKSVFSVVSDLACMFQMTSWPWHGSLHAASLHIRLGSAHLGTEPLSRRWEGKQKLQLKQGVRLCWQERPEELNDGSFHVWSITSLTFLFDSSEIVTHHTSISMHQDKHGQNIKSECEFSASFKGAFLGHSKNLSVQQQLPAEIWHCTLNISYS